jgi:flagellar biosynthetic protein FliP
MRYLASLRAHLPLLGKLLLVLLICAAAMPALAQTLSLDMGDGQGGSSTGRIVQLVALLTVLSLAPGILVMVTSFTRIIVVLSFLRSALGVQQTPPNQVMISLALFLTFFIMAPTFEKAWENGIQPLMEDSIDEKAAFEATTQPFHDFMMLHVRDKDLLLFLDMGKIETKDLKPEDTPLQALVPAFMISELKRAFEIGFLLFLPFLVIDMVIASILMAMGMMMLPPVVISLPFKIIFFVLIDGWYMLAGSLVRSYGG